MSVVKRINHYDDLKVNWYSLRDAFDNTPLMVHALDASGKICYANPCWFDTLGYSEEEVLGRFNGFDILGAISKDYARKEAIPRLMKEGKIKNVRYTFKKKTKELVQVVLNGYVRYDSDGDFLYGIGISTLVDDVIEPGDRQFQNQSSDFQNSLTVSKRISNTLPNSDFIYTCNVFRNQVVRNIEQVVKTDATVLVIGESGTGKELVANSLHKNSHRSHKPFVKINCATLPPNLIESELFGHVKGAFTSAIKDKVGKFEQANGGTIFLDEIGEMPLELQPKLLRVLQEKELERLGDNHTRKVDVRIVAATNRNLQEMAKDGSFRQDLYYRLNVFPIYMPALRERKEDIAILASHFLKKFSTQFDKRLTSLNPGSVDLLERYDWPGNIRELQNVMERSVIKANDLDETLTISQDMVSPSLNGDSPFAPSAGTGLNLKQSEKGLIIKALSQANGKVGGKDGAAELLGLKRTTLIARMNKLNIDVRNTLQ